MSTHTFPARMFSDLLRSKILRDLAIDLFVVPAENFGDVGVFRIDVERRASFYVVKKFLPDRHPILLCAISALIPHR